jgi:hypothetical protein
LNAFGTSHDERRYVHGQKPTSSAANQSKDCAPDEQKSFTKTVTLDLNGMREISKGDLT